MKTYFTILATILALTITACNGFLEESPQSLLPEELAYNTKEDLLNNAVLMLYTHVGGNTDSEGLQGTGRGIYDLNTFTTDEAIMPTRGGDWYDGGFWQGLFLHKWGVNNDAILNTWEYLYRTIILCNRSLKHIEDFATIHTDMDVSAMKAEVKTLRAMFYYYAMDLFGNIPLITEYKDNGIDMKQEKRSAMFRFIVTELQESLPLLSNERCNWPGEYYGRMTQGVACFLLAKLALNAEIYMDDNWTDDQQPDGKQIMFKINGTEKNAWETAIYYCEQLTAMGYTLEPDYTANFAVFNESSAENIFIIPMDKNLYTNQYIYLFRSRNYNHAAAYGLGGENGSSATIEVLETFGYGTPEQDVRFDYCYFTGPVKDLSGNQIYLDDKVTPLVYDPWNIKLDVSGEACEKTAGARMKKYEIDTQAYKDGKLFDNDIVLFRYADVLLMQAEAKVRNGQNGDNELNAVRQRVGEKTRTATLENILAERQLELAWEGWRRQDLIRFGLYTRAYHSRPQLENEANGYTTVFPIPESIIHRYSESMRQNDGY